MRLVRYTYPTYRSLAPVGGFARSPWSGLETEIDRLFETALRDFSGTLTSPEHFPVDIYEDKENTYVRAELPGVSREDINVEMAEGYLTIAATRKAAESEGRESC
ncbi:MAG TPA: Hsp20/alpha crystallin family protein, partial [Opitutaceae bacterium]|nr:Hsp20/alpha crystallin family protein [Opitutaceae bacterium]